MKAVSFPKVIWTEEDVGMQRKRFPPLALPVVAKYMALLIAGQGQFSLIERAWVHHLALVPQEALSRPTRGLYL